MTRHTPDNRLRALLVGAGVALGVTFGIWLIVEGIDVLRPMTPEELARFDDVAAVMMPGEEFARVMIAFGVCVIFFTLLVALMPAPPSGEADVCAQPEARLPSAHVHRMTLEIRTERLLLRRPGQSGCRGDGGDGSGALPRPLRHV